jgi:hypothetical protein
MTYLRKPTSRLDFMTTLVVISTAEDRSREFGKHFRWSLAYRLRCLWSRPAVAAVDALRACGIPAGNLARAAKVRS